MLISSPVLASEQVRCCDLPDMIIIAVAPDSTPIIADTAHHFDTTSGWGVVAVGVVLILMAQAARWRSKREPIRHTVRK